MPLPKGVERVRSRGRSYFYWNPGRGTDRQANRIKLPNAETHPAEFWREVERYTKATPTNYPAGSVGDLLLQYKGSEEFKKNSDSTIANYLVHLNRFKKPEAWGLLPARELTPAGVMRARDQMKDTPTQANHMLSFGRGWWRWCARLNYVEGANPFEVIDDLELLDRGHVPWPKHIVDLALERMPTDLARMVRLGIMVCQRESDLIRMGPGHREKNGIWCRPKKTRKKRRAFHVPLDLADALELDRWAEQPIVFANTRFKQPFSQHNLDLYLYSPRGVAYSENSLRARYHRWLNDTTDGREFRSQWQSWLAEQIKKYEWDITTEDAKNPTIHGLRGTGILKRRAQGNDVDQISNDVGMSRQMVERYMRFKDQMEVATAGAARLKLAKT